MKKSVVKVGVFIFIIGIILTALPQIYIPKTTTEAIGETENLPLLPFEVVYVGIILIFVGIGIALLGAAIG
jgi:hypothetical protein